MITNDINNNNDSHNAGPIWNIYGKYMHRLMEYLYIWTEEQAIDDHDDDAKESADDKIDIQRAIWIVSKYGEYRVSSNCDLISVTS